MQLVVHTWNYGIITSTTSPSVSDSIVFCCPSQLSSGRSVWLLRNIKDIFMVRSLTSDPKMWPQSCNKLFFQFFEHVEPVFTKNIFLRLSPAHFTFLMNKNETADAELQKALEDALQYYEELFNPTVVQSIAINYEPNWIDVGRKINREKRGNSTRYIMRSRKKGVEVLCYWSPIDKGKRETQLGMLFTTHFWKHGGVF